MDKPKTLRDLLRAGHVSLTDIRNIARMIFDGRTTAAGPMESAVEGYVLTASQFDDLPEHVQGFVIKAVLAFGVENVLDAEKSDVIFDAADEDDDEDFEPPTVDNEVV